MFNNMVNLLKIIGLAREPVIRQFRMNDQDLVRENNGSLYTTRSGHLYRITSPERICTSGVLNPNVVLKYQGEVKRSDLRGFQRYGSFRNRHN